jgi:hypothetical protein
MKIPVVQPNFNGITAGEIQEQLRDFFQELDPG